MDFPPLTTERLLLRPIARSDEPFVVQHFLDPYVQRYLLDAAPMTDPAEAVAIIDFYLERPNLPYNRWIVVRRSDAMPLGTCGFHQWNRQHRRAEIGYDLSPQYWGNGYMHEAVAAMLDHGFATLKLQRIEAMVLPANEPSVRILRRHGFRHEGRLRDYYLRDGVFYDHDLFARLRDDVQ